MTFDESFTYCVRHKDSPSLSKYWVFVNALQIFIFADILCAVFYWVLPGVGMSAIVPLALAGALIAWYAYMTDKAYRFINKVR